MKTERRAGIPRVWLAVGWFAAVVLVLATIIISQARRPRPEPLHPLVAIATPRFCEFVGLLSDAFAVCDDGTSWWVEMLAQAEQRGSTTYTNDPPDQQTGDKITVSIDDADGEEHTIKYSWYWPPLCGKNCAKCVDGKCVSRMANGERWQDFIGYAVACPPEWPFGTRVTLDGKTWVCKDRGGMIVGNWVDFLTETPAYVYGTLVKVRVRFVR